jgi:hypothetical protein
MFLFTNSFLENRAKYKLNFLSTYDVNVIDVICDRMKINFLDWLSVKAN